MKLLKFLFTILCVLGYLGNGILFLSIEWSFLQQSFVQIFNPFLHLQVFEVLLTAHLFWVFLTMIVVGSCAVIIIERHLAQATERAEFHAAKTVYQSPQTFPERKPKHSSPSTGSEQNYSNYRNQPPQTFSKSANKVETESVEPQVKLLKWAIQSSQKVRFSYETRDGEKSQRTVNPISFKTFKQTLCLEGYCYLRSAKRHFALKRMQDIEIVSASQANYPPVTDVITSPDVSVQVSPISQLPLPEATQTKNTNTQLKQRLYINYHTNELETIATSEWNNTTVLNQIHYELEFRSRKKALDLHKRIATRLTQLEETEFTWSTTEANSGSQNLSSDVFKYEEGLLKHYGYKVGMSGLSQRERWEILDAVFSQPLLQVDNPAYLNQWGEPKSAKRLKKLADSIATFTRNAKRRNSSSFSKAIQDWETDLTYLKRNYYDNRFSFQYPRT